MKIVIFLFTKSDDILLFFVIYCILLALPNLFYKTIHNYHTRNSKKIQIVVANHAYRDKGFLFAYTSGTNFMTILLLMFLSYH